MSRSLWQRSNEGHIMMLYAYTPHQMAPSSINLLHVMASEIYLRQDFKCQGHSIKVTAARSKVTSRSHHNVAHLHLNQCPFKVSTSYISGFLRNSFDKLFPHSQPSHPFTHRTVRGEIYKCTALIACGGEFFKL